MIKQYRLSNDLKIKLGLSNTSTRDGQIDPKKVAAADEIIRKFCLTSYDDIGKNLTALTAKWEEMKAVSGGESKNVIAKQIFTLAHEVKDIGDLCGYSLISFFAESLRDYIAQTALNAQNQKIIIQAHVDAMNTAHKNKLREDGGAAAEELKRIVRIAIEKYH